MATLADYFTGNVQQEEYSQSVGLEGVAYRWTSENKSQSFDFEGVPASLAFSTDQITVTDVGGTSYTFSPIWKFTDGSTGTLVMPTEQVKVTRSRMSPHMWRLNVTRIGSRYYRNGTLVISGPDWM